MTKQISLNTKVKLSKKEAGVIKKMRERHYIYISRYSNSMGLTGTDITLSNSLIDTLINKDIVAYSHESDIHNFYTLTDLGKSIQL